MPDHEDTGTPGSDLAALLITSQNPGPIPMHQAHGHPRKYNTPEEQAAAHALSQQGYYEQCVSSSAYGPAAYSVSLSEIVTFSVVGAIAVMLTAVTTKNAADATSFPTNHANHEAKGPLQAHQRKATTSENWQNSLDKIRQKLAIQLAHRTSSSFAAKTYTLAVDSNTVDAAATISEALKPFNKLQSWADFITTHIYCKMGCMDLWKDANVVTGQVKEVVDLLQDLLCSALSGVDELKKAYRDGTLLYLEK